MQMSSSWLKLLITFLVFCHHQELTNADGNIGCLFNEQLCVEDVEWCYDDLVFGRCLQATLEPDDLYRYEDLTGEQLAVLESELNRLIEWNYQWEHPYTQCRLQAILYVFKNDLSSNTYRSAYSCHRFLERVIQLDTGEKDNNVDPLAIIQFTPSVSNPEANFADEIYYPPDPDDYDLLQNAETNEIQVPIQPEYPVITADDDDDDNDLDDESDNENLIPVKKSNNFDDISFIPAMHRRDSTVENLPNLVYFKPHEELMYKVVDPEDEEFDRRVALIQQDMKSDDGDDDDVEGEDGETFPESRIYYDDDVENAPGFLNNFIRPLYPAGVDFHLIRRPESEPVDVANSGIFTEGGVVIMPSEKENVHRWKFQRHERLDVKKPGPPFQERLMQAQNKKSLDGSFDADSFAHSLAHHHRYDVDSSYAYVKFKNGINRWNEGLKIIRELEQLLGLQEETFTNYMVEPNQVTFKVEPNNKNWNASQIAEAIEEIKEKIKDKTGIEVVAAGIGYKNNKPIWKAEWLSNAEQDLFVSKLLLGGILAALLMSCVILGLVWRYTSSRQKLQNVMADSEVSQDYQDLCRSRMATKISTGTPPCPQTQIIEKVEGGVHGRITSLSKESEQQSPSSRSSTSSWSEEPVLSNLDISTGHMVLSYMEDHLKNKDRLEQEWVALCAYEAEPCSVAIAQKPENADKNRYSHVLPYDHSRVVLSSLSNLNESDYINASTITDHDPRNPAYIATQGPLPNTAADFWQMVWEQGAVVLVMLTRLTEGGVAQCHRYWPEEGAELHNVYEVHLVSEHIWCDDYLVRSFYLKNMKTGETRTVTQFHFLSWPEMGVPTSTKALLEFRRKVNKSYRGRSCPIIVHCSDGAGRAGTYCLIDMVLNRMSKGAKEIDIAATLEHIRDQRPAMVTTKQQFEFVLMAVAEEVHAILKALPAAIEKQQQQQQQQQAQPQQQQQQQQQH